ncbi:hypothetical protein OIU83_22955 [Flavobacterium sp. LS1R49]|uniref:MORN repeat variant n=1 Tax=Flavobacterium shii TaxID=2987687 RepID=A0A9X3C885_9FLAO|nr:hypothetical protein [Flavobacterium shii]MCV9930538.1 hypothetical protein [Flavobacterium shii]
MKIYKITLLMLFVVIVGFLIIFFSYNDEKIYVLKKYDSKTKKTITMEYLLKNGDTVFHGKCNYYNENGRKISEGNFVNGHVVGKVTNYYDNGKIESIIYYKTNEIKEESTYYSSIGLIEKYIIYNDLGNPSFKINYSNRSVRSYDGHPLLEIYQYKFSHKKQFNIQTNQTLSVGDTLKYKYLLAEIPYSKRTFKIENLSIDNTKVQRIIKKKFPVGIDVDEVLTKKGVNTIRAIVKYEFNDEIVPILNDTISFEVNVN